MRAVDRINHSTHSVNRESRKYYVKFDCHYVKGDYFVRRTFRPLFSARKAANSDSSPMVKHPFRSTGVTAFDEQEEIAVVLFDGGDVAVCVIVLAVGAAEAVVAEFDPHIERLIIGGVFFHGTAQQPGVEQRQRNKQQAAYGHYDAPSGFACCQVVHAEDQQKCGKYVVQDCANRRE